MSNRYNLLARCSFTDKALKSLKRILDWDPKMKWMPDGRYVISTSNGGRVLKVEDFLLSHD